MTSGRFPSIARTSGACALPSRTLAPATIAAHAPLHPAKLSRLHLHHGYATGPPPGHISSTRRIPHDHCARQPAPRGRQFKRRCCPRWSSAPPWRDTTQTACGMEGRRRGQRGRWKEEVEKCVSPVILQTTVLTRGSSSLLTVCCIYHKPRQFDESSSDESSDSDSDSDAGDDDRARRRCNHDHDHGDHGDGAHDSASRHAEGGGVIHELEDSSDGTNAYERAPRRKPKKGQGAPRTDGEFLLRPQHTLDRSHRLISMQTRVVKDM